MYKPEFLWMLYASQCQIKLLAPNLMLLEEKKKERRIKLNTILGFVSARNCYNIQMYRIWNNRLQSKHIMSFFRLFF